MGAEVSPASPGQPQSSKKYFMSEDELKVLADLVSANISNATTEVLNSEEAARYMGVSMSYIYKLMMRRQIPHYKPMGKLCFFNRQELETWLQNNRVATMDELSDRAHEHCMKGGRYGC